MRNLAVKQVAILPLGAMFLLIIVGFTVPGYSSLSQQMSELGLLGGFPLKAEQAAGVTSGLSIAIWSIHLLLQRQLRMPFTGITSMLFGISMIFNGIFKMGSPLHGLYGIGFFVVLTPLFYLVERKPLQGSITWLSKLAAFVTLAYLWSMIAGFDPEHYRGLTQRLAVVPMFGWYTIAALDMLKMAMVSTASVQMVSGASSLRSES